MVQNQRRHPAGTWSKGDPLSRSWAGVALNPVSLAVLAIALVPCVGAVLYGRRASEAGHRIARVPISVGALVGVALVVLTALNI